MSQDIFSENLAFDDSHPVLPDIDVFERRESQVRSYCRDIGTIFQQAEGSNIYDEKGTRYLDFLSGCGSLNYGHNDPDMKQALIAYISGNGLAHGLDFHTTAKKDFLTAFERYILAPRNLDYVIQFTGPTGTNAVEAALKLARKVTGRRNVIAFTNAFHGVTSGALAATGNRHHRMDGVLSLNDVTHVPYDGYLGNDLDSAMLLRALLSDPSSGMDQPAAIILEAVQGEGGLNAATTDWMQNIAVIAKEHGALLIVDDIQAGCGRTGQFFSFEQAGLKPDIVVMAKSLSGFGLPMSAVLIHKTLDIWSPGEHNGTFRGNSHAFITARVALEKFWGSPEFEAGIAVRAKTTTKFLSQIATHLPGAYVVGRGMMQGISVGPERASAICRAAFGKKLIVETSGAKSQVVKILAPLNIPMADLEDGLQILLQSALHLTGPLPQTEFRKPA